MPNPPAQLAQPQSRENVGTPPHAPGVSVIVPAYREAENLPELIARLAPFRASFDLELIIINDASGDNSESVVAALNQPWVRLIIRTNERGLSSAVIRGLRAAIHPTLIVMDADLSHPVEAIPALLAALDAGADFAVGSRYMPGGSTDDQWTPLRALNSRVATALARPFTNLRDPMSGFFAIRKSTFDGAAPLNPVGYKIGLELLVKCRCRAVVEVPIHFATRTRGHSKLTFSERLRYLRHLARLSWYKLHA